MSSVEGTSAQRQAALASYSILDTPREARFDSITRNLADTVKAPMAYISFLDEKRLWFKSSLGLPFLEIPTSTSLTAKFLNAGVTDINAPNFEALPDYHPGVYTTDQVGAKSMLGRAIISPEGVVIGAVCVMFSIAKKFSEEDKSAIAVATNAVVELLELRRVVQAEPKPTSVIESVETAEHHDSEESLHEIVSDYMSETLENFDWWAAQAWWYDDNGLNPGEWVTAPHTPKSLMGVDKTTFGSASVVKVKKAYLEPTLVSIDALEWMQNNSKLAGLGARFAVVMDVFGAAAPTLRLVFIIPSARFFDENTKKFFAVTVSLLPKVITRERVRGEFQYRASHDALTGLLNRRGLTHWIDASKAETTSNRAVMFLDLDNFKALNDKYGHALGDELLIHVASELKSNTRPTDNVARIGGDEFVIVTSETDIDVAHQVLSKRVYEALAKPFTMSNGVAWSGAASIGVAGWPAGADFNVALELADGLMYNAKKGGGGIAYEARESGLPDAAYGEGQVARVTLSKIAASITAEPWAYLVSVDSKLKNPDLDKLAKEITTSLKEAKLESSHLILNLPKALWFEESAIPELINKLTFPNSEASFSVVLNGNGASADAKSIARNLRISGHARTVLSGFGSGNKEFELLQSIQPIALILDSDLVNSIAAKPENQLSVKAVTAICDALEMKAIAPRGTDPENFELINALGCRKQIFDLAQ